MLLGAIVKLRLQVFARFSGVSGALLLLFNCSRGFGINLIVLDADVASKSVQLTILVPLNST